MKRFAKLPSFFGVFLIACLSSGCSGSMSDVIIPINLHSLSEPDQGQAPPANIEIVDLRRDSTMRRTAFSISLGKVTLSPPESELVKQLIINALQHVEGDRSRWKEKMTIYCGIKTFDIVTPAILMYWDVTTRIELMLRVLGNERTVAGEAVERTWVYPSEEIIGRVTTLALQQVAAGVNQELPVLLSLVP
jgi:hypothetical protein